MRMHKSIDLPFYRHPGFYVWGLALLLLLGLNAWNVAFGQPADLEDLKAAYEKSPRDAEAAYALGTYYYGLQNWEEAEKYYLKTIEVKPDHMYALFRLGNIYFRMQLWDDAKVCYQKVLEIDANLAGPYINLATIAEVQKDSRKALEYYARAAKAEPSRPEPFFGLGDVFFGLEEWDKAITSYEQGLKLLPEEPTSEEQKRDRKITMRNLATARAVVENEGIVPAEKILLNLNEPQIKTRAVLLPGMPVPTRQITLRKIYFPTNQYRTDTLGVESRKQLDELADALISMQEHGGGSFIIEGHTDQRGSAEYNQKLSGQRARAILDYLVRKGIPRESMSSVGKGEEELISTADTEEAWRLNRRVVVKRIYRKQDLEIDILRQDENGDFIALEKNRKLPVGAKYKIRFKPLEGANIYVLKKVNELPPKCIFPEKLESAEQPHTSNPAEAGQEQLLPIQKDFYEVSKDSNSIVLQFYTSQIPITDLEQIVLEGTPVAASKLRGILSISYMNRPGPEEPEGEVIPENPEDVEPDETLVADSNELDADGNPVVLPNVLRILPDPVSEIEIEVE